MALGSTINLYTSMSYEEAAHIIRESLYSSSKDVNFQKKQVGNDAFASVDGYLFGAFVTGKEGTIFKKQWALHVQMYDEGGHTRVLLGVEHKTFKEMATVSFAYSDKDIFTRQGEINKVNFDKKLGEEKVRQLIEILRQRDPNLEVE